MRTKFLIIISILAFLAFLDTTYLTILHFQNAIPPCTLISGCDKVVTSQFSTLLGIPISLLGSLYYLLLLILSVLILQKNKYLNFLFIFAVIGFLISAFLFAVQALIIHSYCQYCLFSEAISVLILLFSFILLRLKKES